MAGLRALGWMVVTLVTAVGGALGQNAAGGAQGAFAGMQGVVGGVQGSGERSSVSGAVQFADGTANLVSGLQGFAEAGVPPAEASVGGAMRDLAARADVVFVGQVARVERKGGVVEIEFAVQEPVMGSVGGTYTLKEWGGLWAAGEQRFTVGQRAMVFLHAPNAAGLSSPVDGMDGVVPVIVQGADVESLLDVRWLATRVTRAPGAPIADAENGAVALGDGVAMVKNWKETTRPEPVHMPLPVGVRGAPVTVLPVSHPVVRPTGTSNGGR